MRKSLLIEIGVEELPAIPFLKELPKIEQKWQEILSSYGLDSDAHFYYTPRRLIFWHESFALKQDDSVQELYGAPIEIAYKDGEPSAAALGFAKKCGVDFSEISHQEKNGKEVLYYQKNISGKESETLLPEMIQKLLGALQFGKTMRWGDNKESFIRPIRWLGVMLGDRLVEMSAYGVQSAMQSYGHRTFSYESFSYSNVTSFFEGLKSHGVMVDAKEREAVILSHFKKIEQKEGCHIEIDSQLLAEVVAITEHPMPLLGTFDAQFLTLPCEVVITSMKEHQRYFAVFKEERLSNQFIVVSNAITEDFDAIVKGNEKVLHARLSDGLFFYENDLKRGLETEGLKNITYMQGAGSLYEKTEREWQIASTLASKYTLGNPEELKRAVMLSKADLLTDMVYEFTELQGLMGYYYAQKAGEADSVAWALKEQYLPTGEDSKLPSSDMSAIVAMSYKLDAIMTLFALGKIPTGTKDPFALRRAAIGIIKIVLDRGFAFDIHHDIETLAKGYVELNPTDVEAFFLDRIAQYFDANGSIIQAVVQTGERDLLRMSQKIEALSRVASERDFKSYSSTFKRIANIIKDVPLEKIPTVDASLLQEEAERVLYAAFMKVQSSEKSAYHDRLEALFGLKPEIDHFFEQVLVNVEEEALQKNRKNLISAIYLSFKEIADIKEITL